MAFNSETHHRRSLRIKNRDYSREGYYFVTICARNRETFFADFGVGVGLAPTPNDINKTGQPQGLPLHKENNPSLVLTMIGRIIEKNWQKIAKENIKTDTFVVMPNHIHGIIIVKPHPMGVGAGLAPALDFPHDFNHGHPQGMPLHKENAPTPVLGDIIGAFKSRCVVEYLKFIDDNNLNKSAKI
ncbi:MAG: hypothetical protein NTW95_05555 [Candidatus Aminicenantes bacterium]|nr:hypothetical protein [Candidatus Aminicenantes bacterium]